MTKIEKLYKWLYSLKLKGFEIVIIDEVLNKIAQIERERK